MKNFFVNFFELLFTLLVVLPIALTLGAIPYRIGGTAKARDFLGWQKLKESLYRDTYLYEEVCFRGIAYTLIKGYQDFDIFRFVTSTGGGFVCQTDDHEKDRIFIDYKLAEQKDLLEAVLLHEAGHLYYQPEKSKVTCWWLRQWWEIQADYYAYSRSAKNARLILGLIRRMKLADLLVEHGPRALVLWVVSLFA